MDLRERLEHIIRQELDRRGLSRMYPTVMFQGEKICFRLSDPKTIGISKWSNWLSEDEVQPEHPEPVLDQVRALLVDLGYDADVVEDQPVETISFNNLMEILRRLPERVPCESMQLVLISRASGIAQFVDVDDNPSLRDDVQTALTSSSIPLGVIAWTREGERLQGSKMTFPWVKQDPVATEVFEKICDEAGEKVGEAFGRRGIS